MSMMPFVNVAGVVVKGGLHKDPKKLTLADGDRGCRISRGEYLQLIVDH